MATANPSNGQALSDYINAELVERNIADSTREWKVKTLTWLSDYFQHQKTFRGMTRQDILGYLNSLRKTVDADPEQRWIGTYNNRVLVLTKFFRWLYKPNEPDYKKRKTPACMSGIKQLPKKTKTPYKPADLWTPAEHDVFLRYCPLKRDRCYHAMARDTSARPHELLKLKIGDVQFKVEPSTGKQYAEILVSGKTKSRTLPLIDSIPYVKEWIAEHPYRGNPDHLLFIALAVNHKGAG
jgi:integrase